jgi:hypothetical protein
MRYGLNTWLLKFRDSETEAEYRMDQFDRIIGPIRVLLLVAGFMFILAWLFNALVRAEQDDITNQVLIELAFFNGFLAYALIPLCFVLFTLSYLSVAKALYQFSASLMAVLVVVSSVALVLSTADLTAQHYSFGFLLINTWVVYTISRLRYLYATFICFGGMAIYVALLFYRFPNPLEESATYLFLLAVTNFLGPLASFQLDRTSRLEWGK